MPEGLFPWEFEPVESRRKKYTEQGGLGNDLNGHHNPREIRQYRCCHCQKTFQWNNNLEFTDYGQAIDNLCPECRQLQRAMMTNHPEMK